MRSTFLAQMACFAAVLAQGRAVVIVVGHSVTVLASGRLRDLGCATAFLMSCLFAVQVRTQLDLLTYWKVTATYKNEVYFLPNQLDEKMAITPPCVS